MARKVKNNMDNELKNKAQEYKAKLEQLTTKKQEIERQLIITEEQYNQYKEKIEQAFGTSDPEKLQDIAKDYLEAITVLEGQLDVLI
jgi:phage shock protein A